MTQGLLVELGGMGLSAALESYPAETQELFMKSYSVGSQYGVLLPYSRAHENEAGHMGLIFMAMAGYDPHEAVGFWERMAAAKQDSPAPPEFLSTHPADSTRIRKIKELIPTDCYAVLPKTINRKLTILLTFPVRIILIITKIRY
jgi:predicted Zn-dependent protease